MIFGCQREFEFETSATGVLLKMDRPPKGADRRLVGSRFAIQTSAQVHRKPWKEDIGCGNRMYVS